ncbi:MAG: putative xylosidase/arabinosidase [Arthrobacter sp.]|nr:putative xylosidase/arabinosidase [Arthrobacter sp.]MCU1547686.1 putative xylosidase/arabinosidase [Arthrobacter sp.]
MESRKHVPQRGGNEPAVLLSGDQAVRLLLRIDDSHWYAIEASGRQVRALARIGPLQQAVATVEIDPAPGALQLEIACNDSPLAGQPGKNAGPDEVTLGFRQPGQPTTLARMDGRYLSTEVAGGFTGRVIGLAATNGTVVIERFEYNDRD